MIKETVNICIRWFIRSIIRIFFVLPIKQKRILFQSYKGQAFTCNPKYISEYIFEHDKSFEHIWVLNKPSKSLQYGTVVKFNSLRYLYYRTTAKYIVCNTPVEVYIPKRKKQIVINTWHAGGAYKRIGMDFHRRDSQARNWQWEIVRTHTSMYVSSSKMFTASNIEQAYQYSGEILNSGMPRNDLFFDEEKIERVNKKIRSIYTIPHESYVVLYAPTYRRFAGDEQIDITLPFFEIAQIFSKYYNRNVVFLNRSHYSLNQKISVNPGVKVDVIDVSEYEDMQELLASSDMLITDYSSSIWDFSFLGRPCLLYTPDLKSYDAERGFYIPIEKWPGIVCENEEQLLVTLQKLDNINFKSLYKAHHELLESYENGHGSEAVYDYILKNMEDKG